VRVLPIVASVALVALSFLASGCDDDGVVRIHGRILNADGSPAANLQVVAASYALDLDTASETGPATLPLTDAEGRYELVGHLVDRGFPAARISVLIVAPDGTTRLQLSIPAESGDHSIPDLRLWDDGLARTTLPGGAGERITWNPAPEGADAIYDLEAYQGGPSPDRNGPPSWAAHALTAPSYDLAPEMVEDRFTTLQVYIGYRDPEYFCQEDLCVKWLSSRLVTAQGTLVPLSRGATCSATSGQGDDVPLLGPAGGPCTLTDGYIDYASYGTDRWVCGPRNCSDLRGVVVDLGEATPIQTIVVHGLFVVSETTAVVEVSADGGVFTTVETFDPSASYGYEVVHLATPTTARFVRVRAPVGTLAAFDELSVF
jgi:hypothetical protein